MMSSQALDKSCWQAVQSRWSKALGLLNTKAAFESESGFFHEGKGLNRAHRLKIIAICGNGRYGQTGHLKP